MMNNTPSSMPAQKKRIGVIDLLKGLTIYGVIMLHAHGSPSWLTPYLVNTTFFFISGMFFVPTGWRELLVKRFWQLIVPTLVFYVLSYPYAIIQHYWDFRTLETFNWSCILDIFRIEQRSDYLFVNVPLWFLPCLFFVQVYYNALLRLPQWAIGIGISVSYFCAEAFYSIPSPFMMNNALYNVCYFGLGSLLAPHILPLLSRVTLFDNLTIMRPLRFIGANTLALLCMHDPICTVIHRYFYKIFQTDTVPLCIINALLTCLICAPFIIYLNRHGSLAPFLRRHITAAFSWMGKKE